MYAQEKRVHFAPTKTVYSAPQVASSDAPSIASSSPAQSRHGTSPLPPHPFQLPQAQFQSPSPASASSAELSTPPPPPGFYYGQYGHYANQEYQGRASVREREVREGQHQRWQQQQQQQQQEQDQEQDYSRYEYSPSPSHVQPQHLLDQPSSASVYPRTPFYPAAELDPYPSTEYDVDQYHHSHSPSPAFSFSPFPSDSYPPKPVIPRTVHIHYLLAYAPYGDPAFTCDLTRPPPHLAELYHKFHSGQPYRDGSSKFDVFYEPATSPPMNSIVVTHPSLKFTIDVCAGADTSRVVRPRSLPGHYPRSHYGHGNPYDDGYGSSSSSDEGDMRLREQGFVTVADVLVCLYRELRLAIHPVEYAELAPGVAQRVNDAYFSRCASLSGSDSSARDQEQGREMEIQDWADAEREREQDRDRERIAEEKKGIRKVDLLMGHTWFVGLSGTLHGPGVWELNVAE